MLGFFACRFSSSSTFDFDVFDMAVISRVSALALAFAGVCSAVEKRDLKAIEGSYDYVVVGGGVSGLVVANRLTEDSNSTFPWVL